MHDSIRGADETDFDAIVVGGGVGGLTAATLLARGGRKVVLFERAAALGGRAQSQRHGAFQFNLGPHALYRGGAARRVFDELGLQLPGGIPSAAGGFAIASGRKHALPGGFVSLLTTSLMRLPAKLELARLMTSLPKLHAQSAKGATFREWVGAELRTSEVRALVEALSRVSTYANAAHLMCAAATLEQMQLAFTKNVEYLDGGWQSIVEALRLAAENAGVVIRSGKRVVAVEHDTRVRAVRLHDGSTARAGQVLLAMGPDEAAALVPTNPQLKQWSQSAIPVRAACLDLALTRLPQPRATFALGIDQPVYFSVHSAVAKQLAPGGAAMIHVAKYLDPTTESQPKQDERELEQLAELVQPGWREVVSERRFLPSLTVYHALVTANGGGYAGRPGPQVPSLRGLFVVGDWVGPEGMLVDAAIASAKQAALQVLASSEQLAAA